MTPEDAAELSEAVTAGLQWNVVAEQIGERRLQAASAAAAGESTVREAELRAAAAAFNFAQMSFSHDVPRKTALYARFSENVSELARISNGRIRRIEVSVPAGTLVGWLCLPFAETPHPSTVIQWGGLSGWGATYLKSADQLNRRGIACLLAEGPGQGTPRLQAGIHLDETFAEGFGAFVTAAVDHPDLGSVVGIQGNSFGGLIAAHVAAADPRVKACVINGAPSHPELPEFRTPREQMLAVFGVDATDAWPTLAALRFDPATHRIGCPILVLQGGADPLATPDRQAAFLEAADPREASSRVWDDGEHTIYNHADERDREVAEWFVSVFDRASVTEEGDLRGH